MGRPGLAPRNLVLASGSKIRSRILTAAGMTHDICPATIDERAVETEISPPNASQIARALAAAKALDVSARFKDRLVLGADQTLSLGGELLHKPASLIEARRQLLALRGRMHSLHAAIALALDGVIVFEHVAVAALKVRTFSEAFLDAYLEHAGETILSSVGCYHIEGLGSHLFESIEGDQFTIMGLPLLPLQQYLRSAGYIVG